MLRKKKDPNSWYEQYKVARMNSYRIVNDEFVEELGAKLIDHGLNSDGSEGFCIFMMRLGIRWTTFHIWMDKFPTLKEDYEEAKLLFGERRECNALKRQFDPGLAKFSLFRYLPEYKETQKFLSQLTVTDPDGNRPRLVLIENYGEAPKIAISSEEDAAKTTIEE